MKEPTRKEARANERVPIRERLTAALPGTSDEAVAGALLRSAAVVRPFGPKELAEVSARLRSKEHFRPRPLAWQIAIAVSLVLFGSGLAVAVSHVLRMPSINEKREPPVAAPTSKPKRHTSLGSSHLVAQPPSPLPEMAPLPESVPPARPVSTPPVRALAFREKAELRPAAQSPDPTLAPPAAAAPSSLALESRLLARAISKLRQEGEAAQALAILDEHRAEFGDSGVLAPEAKATRIEALLRLGRHSQALALLDAERLAATGVERDMLLARAELRADKGRRVSALHDFDLLLRADAPPDSVTERAIYGRAVCRGKMDNWKEARLDFERYLATFPDGIFADETRAALNH
jgi:hypothetical protein